RDRPARQAVPGARPAGRRAVRGAGRGRPGRRGLIHAAGQALPRTARSYVGRSLIQVVDLTQSPIPAPAAGAAPYSDAGEHALPGTAETASEHRFPTESLFPDAAGSSEIRRTVLPGGIRVITEAMPTVRSVTLGVLVCVGSRDEDTESAGASHYLEHLLFKGTARRSALDISASIEAVGGEINAFTTKEYTCYYARVLDADLPLAADVITDVVAAALIRAEDVESERGVILEEIAMTDDDPG